MSRIQMAISQAIETGGGEAWVCPGQEIRIFVGGKWKALAEPVPTSLETKNFFASMMNDIERKDFFENGAWQGQAKLGARWSEVTVQLLDSGIAGSFRWRRAEDNDFESWGLPSHFVETLNSARGLTLIFGPRSSGKSALIRALTEKCSHSDDRLTQFFSSAPGSCLVARATVCQKSILDHGISSPHENVFIDDLNAHDLSCISAMLNNGKNVVATMNALDLQSGLGRWFQMASASSLNPFSELHVALGTHLVTTVEGIPFPALEFLMMNQALRNDFSAAGHGWPDVLVKAVTGADKAGQKTLNQSLLSLVLKRRIDMKTAFRQSRDPDNLDQLLKKVGI